MSNRNTSGRRREFRQAGTIPPDTLVTTDNYPMLLTKDSLLNIANSVSRQIKRKMRPNEVDLLTSFIARLPETEFYQKSYEKSITEIAGRFITRRSTELGLVREEDLDEHLSGIDGDTDSGGIVDYEKKELLQFTPSENAFKYSVFADRRGNAIIDRDRVDGKRSSPNNILPLSAEKSQRMVNEELFKGMKLIQNFLDPKSTEEMMSRIQAINTEYNSVNLVRQLVQFDSRNRSPIYANTSEYQWNVHSAGQPGQLGNVRTIDTIQQVLVMTIYPFWAPINNSTLNIYDKIRLLIREFVAQSVVVAEFNSPDQSAPTMEYYHFELEVTKKAGDRMYLVPVQSKYKFRTPMARVETITTQFRTPYQMEIFDPDSGIFTITYGFPTLFTITSPAVHLLNTGDLIYVYNSDSGNTFIDAELNRPQGHIITKLSDTEFTIAVDSSTVVGDEDNIHVYYGSKRLFFQLEFLSLEQ